VTRERWVHIALLLVLVGSIAWLLKVVGIARLGSGNVTEGPLFLLGAAMLLVGSSGFGGTLMIHASRRGYVVACVLSPIVFAIFFTMMDPLGRAILDPDLPQSLYDESGIVITSAVALVLALILLRRTRREAQPVA